MDSLASEIEYQWSKARDRQKTISQMQDCWHKWIGQSAKYQCLADKRKDCIRFLWHHTRARVLRENQAYGRWLEGRFYGNWADLPYNYRYSNELLKTLPSGHFWVKDGLVTSARYFVTADRIKEEDANHFTLPRAIN